MMYQFYIKGTLKFPTELTDEQVEAGVILSLMNGDLIQIGRIDDEIQLKIMTTNQNASVGILYGVSHGSEWIDSVTQSAPTTKNLQGANGDWVKGLTEKEAAMHQNATNALVIGEKNATIRVRLRDYGEVPEIKCSLRIEPTSLNVNVGEVAAFYVYDGMSGVAEQRFEIGEGAEQIEQTDSKLVVGAKTAGRYVKIEVKRTYEDGRTCVGEALLIIEGGRDQVISESPAPAEPYEPPNLVIEEATFEEAVEVGEAKSNIEPGYRIQTHRKRGMRESDKLNQHHEATRHDIESLMQQVTQVNQKMVQAKASDEQSVYSTSDQFVEKSGSWTIEKKPYEGFVRLPCFGCEKVLSKTIKLNSKLLNVEEGQIEDYGILVLTGEALKAGGKLEVKATWTEEIDDGKPANSKTLVHKGQDILRTVHRIIGGE